MSGIIGGAGSRSGVIGTTELDYEEGNFTTYLKGTTGQPSPTINTDHANGGATYVRVGNLVSIQIIFSGVNTTSYSGAIYLEGLPFPASNTGAFVANCMVYNAATWNGYLVGETNGTTIYFIGVSSGNTWVNAQHQAGSARYIYVTANYHTDLLFT